MLLGRVLTPLPRALLRVSCISISARAVIKACIEYSASKTQRRGEQNTVAGWLRPASLRK